MIRPPLVLARALILGASAILLTAAAPFSAAQPAADVFADRFAKKRFVAVDLDEMIAVGRMPEQLRPVRDCIGRIHPCRF